MKDERRWSFGAWLTLAAGIAWLVFCLGYALYVFQFPQDGWGYISDDKPFGAYIAAVNMTGQPSELQAGDRIVAINGLPIVDGEPPPFPSGLREGQTVNYTVERNGETLELTVPLRHLNADSVLYNTTRSFRASGPYGIVALLAILVIGFAFIARPGNLGARYLFLSFSYFFVVIFFGFSASGLYLPTFPRPASFIYDMLGLSWGWAFFASLTLMPLAFPVVKAPLRRFPRLLPLLTYGLAFTSSIIYLAVQGEASQRETPPTFLLYAVLAVVSIFGTLIHNWLTVREPVARTQLRWMTLGLGLGLGAPFSIALVVVLSRSAISGAVGNVFWLMLALPVCLAIAITRYRLFDIDIIIRRTLVYALVTALLALVFYGSVLSLQRLFTSLTGQESAVAVVASTLVIAALFGPLRRRVQDFIDRRFYRRKYDAQEVLARFGIVAREETDLDGLSLALYSAVQKTLEPTKTGIWLAPPERRE